jgi:hypothetical protein
VIPENRAVSPAEILISLRQFRNALKNGKMKVEQGGRDRTKREIKSLESDIAFVKQILRQRPTA